MNVRIVIVTCFIVVALFFALDLQPDKNIEAFSNQTIKYGSSGKDVDELQGRLKFLGYYYSEVDGQFGNLTLQALKNFQYAFGLKADGIAGSKTKLKLWEATKKWRPTAKDTTEKIMSYPSTKMLPLSENDMKLMANAVHGEARGEPYEGQIAVAAVIINRVQSELFPNTVSDVIFQPRAFTAVADGQIYLTPNQTSYRAVRDALSGLDPSGDAIYYFNPDTATSPWIWTRPQIKRIGKHIFCK
ncbi:spore cortex-lytic enzyme [Longirhabdus pacifica]|uniref:spore cortex-lytic enzyme n=1 Tax=Longirhabdus pacifica TaxID=2305227 RepID=UPI001008A6A1|nr:spore cortex-lytic enzyme [Longirhabdus pacifica]